MPLTQLGVKAACLNSTLDWREAQAVEQAIFSGQLDLVHIAPERLLLDRTLAMLDALSEAGKLALFAIDEAHCVSQWGHDFRRNTCNSPRCTNAIPVPRIALTATADQATRNEILQRLGLGEARVFLSSFDRPNIRYTVVEKDNAKKQLLGFLAGRHGQAGSSIACRARRSRKRPPGCRPRATGTALPRRPPAPERRQPAPLPARGRPDHVRHHRFRHGHRQAGCALRRPSRSAEKHRSLLPETGRAGRDGEPSEAWMAYGMQDVALQHAASANRRRRGQKILEAQRLTALLAYCEAPRCRRQVLLNYFGEERQPCGNCDVCTDPPELWDGTQAAQKALSAIFRTGMRFGVTHLTDIPAARQPPTRVKQWNHDQLPTFGVGSDSTTTPGRAFSANWRQPAWCMSTWPNTVRCNDRGRARVLKGETSARCNCAGQSNATNPVAGAAAPWSAICHQPTKPCSSCSASGAPIRPANRPYRPTSSCTTNTARTGRSPSVSHGLLAGITGMGSAKIEHYGAELLELICKRGNGICRWPRLRMNRPIG